MSKAQVLIIADSISQEGKRITTFQLRYWRGIHSELMAHRVFSRNAGSSRARPSGKIIEQVINDPWGPIHWGKNEPGMQANAELEGVALDIAKNAWRDAAYAAGHRAKTMLVHGVHKQIVNRLLEPFTYIDVVVTATDYANWFALRDHKDAQPEIQELARMMRDAMNVSIPKLLKPGEWHLPYITKEDWEAAYEYALNHGGLGDEDAALELLKKASAARCARVSYKLFDGSNANFEKDLELFNRLLVSQPLHASPAEHIASPDVLVDSAWQQPKLHGNLHGWVQYRRTLSGGICDTKSNSRV